MWRRASLSLLRHATGARGVSRTLTHTRADLFSASAFRRTSPLFFSDAAGSTPPTKRVEDVLPIATGLEREEIEAELQGMKRFETEPPVGPFGTKEAPAVVESYFNKRLVGCPGGEGEEEHDVIWFWLEKDKPHECPVCSQYFVLKVIGEGGDPDGHDDDEDEHGHH